MHHFERKKKGAQVRTFDLASTQNLKTLGATGSRAYL